MTAALLRLNSRTFASLRRHRNYRLFFYGQMVSTTGTWMQDVALPWVVLSITHSPVYVGALVFARFLPFMVFGLFTGVLADQFDNRRVMMITQAVSMLVAAGLAVLAFSGVDVVWPYFVFAFLGGTALVFDAPNRHALTFRLVGRDELPNAVALNSSLFNAGRIVGPALGGVLIAAAGAGWCFAINAVSFLAVLTALLLMRVSELYSVERRDRTAGAIREGFAYVWRTPPVLIIIALTAVVGGLGFNFRVILPVLASSTLHADAAVFGALFAAFGVGALLGALSSAALGRGSWKAVFVAAAGFNTALILLAPVRNVVLAAVLLLCVGFCFSMWTSNSQTILQLTAPDALRGRVVGLYLFVFAGLAPIGGLLAGFLADIGGTELALVFAGAMGLLATVLAYARLRGVRLHPARRRRDVAVVEEI